MPKETFFNLPEKKRENLLNIAIEEFAAHPYRSASISNIVRRAGIAKGSLYQYFENKKDLYQYLIQRFIEEKNRYFDSLKVPDPTSDLFEYLRWIAKAGSQFELSSPLLGKLIWQAMHDEDKDVKDAIDIVRKNSVEFFTNLIRKGQKDGEVDSYVDPEVAAFILNTLFMNFGRFLCEKQKLDVEEIAEGKRSPAGTEEGVQAYDALIYLLEKGLQAKE